MAVHLEEYFEQMKMFLKVGRGLREGVGIMLGLILEKIDGESLGLSHP